MTTILPVPSVVLPMMVHMASPISAPSVLTATPSVKRARTGVNCFVYARDILICTLDRMSTPRPQLFLPNGICTYAGCANDHEATSSRLTPTPGEHICVRSHISHMMVHMFRSTSSIYRCDERAILARYS
jgi:hypothetical protein